MRWLTLLSLGSFALTVRAAAYVGCVASTTLLSSPASITGVGLYLSSTSLANCLSGCVSATNQYAYFLPITATLGTCYCSSGEPTIAQLNGAYNAGPGTCGALSYQTYRLPTTFTNVAQCSSPYLYTGLSVAPTPNSPSDCFVSCRNFLYAVIILPGTGVPTAVCNCATSINFGATTVKPCGPGVGIGFSHPASASGQARRRAIINKKRMVEKKSEISCPGKGVACQIPGSTEWECLDVASELESCGGCLEGVADTTVNSTRPGQNCLTIPGVAMGGVTCTQGRCDVYACKSGYTLQNGICIPE